MTDQVRDFVATYKPKPTPEPFFGFFKVGEYTAKRIFRPRKKPMYIYVRVQGMINRRQSDEHIMTELSLTRKQLSKAKYYFKHYVRPRSFKST